MSKDELIEALRKKALGHYADTEIGGEKVKYVPPCMDAWKLYKEILSNNDNPFEFMSQDELIAEVEKMLGDLKGETHE